MGEIFERNPASTKEEDYVSRVLLHVLIKGK